QVKKRQGLVQCHFTGRCLIASHTIHNVRLQPEQLGKNIHDHGCLPVPGKSENDAPCLVQHSLPDNRYFTRKCFNTVVGGSKYKIDSGGGLASVVVGSVPGGSTSVGACLPYQFAARIRNLHDGIGSKSADANGSGEICRDGIRKYPNLLKGKLTRSSI